MIKVLYVLKISDRVITFVINVKEHEKKEHGKNEKREHGKNEKREHGKNEKRGHGKNEKRGHALVISGKHGESGMVRDLIIQIPIQAAFKSKCMEKMYLFKRTGLETIVLSKIQSFHIRKKYITYITTSWTPPKCII